MFNNVRILFVITIIFKSIENFQFLPPKSTNYQLDKVFCQKPPLKFMIGEFFVLYSLQIQK